MRPTQRIHYAVQLALYTDILQKLGYSAGPFAFVWDVHGKEVPYKFDETNGVRNPQTLWQDYQEALAEARRIVSGTEKSLPAYSATCKNCVWYTACLKELSGSDDLTLIPGLGRSKRDVMIDSIPTISDLAAANPAGFINGVTWQDYSGTLGDSSGSSIKAQLFTLEPEQVWVTEKISGLDARTVDQRVATVHGLKSSLLLFFARVAREIGKGQRKTADDFLFVKRTSLPEELHKRADLVFKGPGWRTNPWRPDEDTGPGRRALPR